MKLDVLLDENRRHEGISVREIGRRIGVAHTTVGRILDGRAMDLPTVEKVAVYLQINPADLLNAESSIEEEALGARIAALCETEPALAKVFREVIRQLDDGEISPEVVRDITRYIAYRLALEVSG